MALLTTGSPAPESVAALTWIFVLVLVMVALPLQAAPHVPDDDHQVVERLRSRPLDGSERELRQWRAALRTQPNDVALAVRVARRCIEVGRRDGDPRFYGYAQAALQPWWGRSDAPAATRLLKATLLQASHDFDAALIELDAVLRVAPNDAQALLIRASVYQVQGRLAEAASDCQRLHTGGAAVFGDACLAELATLSGHEAAGAQALQTLAAQAAGRDDAATAGWLALIQAEAAERRGDAVAAERHYRIALQGDADVYTRGAFADFLLDQQRPDEVIALIADDTRADALMLRLALAWQQRVDGVAAQPAAQPAANPAAKRTAQAMLDTLVAGLQARFDAAHLRGEVVHRREEARFLLALRKQPVVALQLALANWAVQREPADAWLVLAAARASNADAQGEGVRAALRATGLKDHRLRGLL